MARSETGSFREGTSDPSESPGTSERENSDESISRFDGDTSFRDFDFFYGEYFDRRPRGPRTTTRRSSGKSNHAGQSRRRDKL